MSVTLVPSGSVPRCERVSPPPRPFSLLITWGWGSLVPGTSSNLLGF